MEVSEGVIWTVGISAQVFFASRQITQWVASEKAQSIQSPGSFWILSVIGCTLFMIYGVMRVDLPIIIGNFLNFYICCRNLYFKGLWKRWPSILQYSILTIPLIILGYTYVFHPSIIQKTIINTANNTGILILGTFGYLIFTLRFVYQWYFAERVKLSYLPVGFFVLSIIGSLLLISYGIFRKDFLIIISFSGGLVVYLRNLYINYYITPKNSESNHGA